mmetsp:Transcript_65485/g.172780  ORF Transcript_65485/g.172780 Transcript_65485/m.172780 type:complete len:116 (+) Transcript_65485:152-499(+)
MAPSARLADGALTLAAVHGNGTCGLLPLFPKVLDGAHEGAHASIITERVRAIRLSPAAGAPSSIGIDGEYVGRVIDGSGVSTAPSVEVVSYPAALRVFMAPKVGAGPAPTSMARE